MDCKSPDRGKVHRNLLVNHSAGCDGGRIVPGDLQASILAEVHSSDAGKVFLQYRTIDGSLGKLAIGKEWFGKVPTTVGSEVVLTGKGNDKSIEEFNKSISALRACATPGAAGLCSANVSISDGANLKVFLKDLKPDGVRF